MSAINGIIGAHKDFSLKRGDSWIYSLQAQDFAGNPLDFTTATSITGWIGDKVDGNGENIITLDLNEGILISGVAHDQLDISKVMDAALILKDKYYYGIVAVFPAFTATIIYGQHKF